MIVSELEKKKIDFSENDFSVIGILFKNFPIELVNSIIDFSNIRFTTYSWVDSNYYRYRINSIISWPKWRERNNLGTYEVSVDKLKMYARREINNERLSLLIYGF